MFLKGAASGKILMEEFDLSKLLISRLIICSVFLV
ncbi:hypothetical protein CBM2631_P250030 [Cupriavidus taiwanensis]|uniref:Uncharacterized protein n=1 Tax=Cupriavidus taiwanensis TaxID=164546 RepID=A0A375GQE7_9BURK|nr:hypothetical protein CBM2597_P170010 [Cupriavidus taiwanensis]SOZ95176.1 hypothetical protein CBM2598_P160035 [Cupriavidus taiwanensis]SPA21591.1 hypothetical protein CBM2631_P250030 [Cupriavidus taiwanensis]SPA35259.1 hypothetical protein CBM2637_P240009 [Cupriavidus taiwanensis]SPC24705.1 hypothetical protein CT19431_P60009 [Cupriavidus taiwanensis]